MTSIAKQLYQVQPVQLELAGMALSAPQHHYLTVHEAQRGTVVFWSPDDQHKHQKIEPTDSPQQALAMLDGRPNVFMSVNEFYGWRAISKLKALRACYVDIDAKLAHSGQPATLQDVLDALTAARMPAPTLVVHSGRGMHLYWLLEHTHPKALPVWQLVQNALIQALKPLGADAAAKDCARVLRLVGTVNGKNGKLVSGQKLSGTHWPLHILADEVLGVRPAKADWTTKEKAIVRCLTTAKARRGHAIHAGACIFARWYLVFQDLVKIAQSHPNGIPEGYRNNWMFLVAVSLSWYAQPEVIEDEILMLTRDWTNLSESEARSSMQPVLKRAAAAARGEKVRFAGAEFDPRYRFKRETLWEWLEGIIKPELIDSLRAIVPSSVSKARKAARDKARSESHHASTETRQKALEMAANGMPKTQISAELGVPRPTIIRWIKAAAAKNTEMA